MFLFLICGGMYPRAKCLACLSFMMIVCHGRDNICAFDASCRARLSHASASTIFHSRQFRPGILIYCPCYQTGVECSHDDARHETLLLVKARSPTKTSVLRRRWMFLCLRCRVEIKKGRRYHHSMAVHMSSTSAINSFSVDLVLSGLTRTQWRLPTTVRRPEGLRTTRGSRNESTEALMAPSFFEPPLPERTCHSSVAVRKGITSLNLCLW